MTETVVTLALAAVCLGVLAMLCKMVMDDPKAQGWEQWLAAVIYVLLAPAAVISAAIAVVLLLANIAIAILARQ